MKILFAVSNENVSNKIVDSYKKRYGETISFKNVFYFNAIIKEIQKDKTYDRIVISEDLEPFSNNNYEVIDRFIVQRLQDITYQNTNQNGNKIDIIVICTDRRTKSSFVLTKMFELGIYNALVGADRRIDNVCKLLNTPRTMEEAKEYYNINAVTENETNSIDDVSEQEVQNILIHYKKLGKNEERYADSFNNIAAQYTDKQLKVIIKCLPINVRAVLEAECPKYQELVTFSDENEQEKRQKEKIQEQRRIEQLENEKRLKNKIEKDKKQSRRDAQRNISQEQAQAVSGIDLLDNKKRQTRMTGNVIVPDNINIKNERKLYSDDELNTLNSEPRKVRNVNSQVKNSVETEDINEGVSINQQATSLPGIDTGTSVAQSKKTNDDLQSIDLPGFEEFNQVDNNQPSSISLPGFEDLDEKVEDSKETNDIQSSVSLPGIEMVDNLSTVENNINQQSSLPGLDDLDDLLNSPEGANIQDSQTNNENVLSGLENLETKEVKNEIDELAPEAISAVSENGNIQKRGRGRPRKYPEVPAKPKGKRGRPRKNPLPEENLQNPVTEIPNIETNNQSIETLSGLEEPQKNIASQITEETINKTSAPVFPGSELFEKEAQKPITLNSTQTSKERSNINESNQLPGLEDNSLDDTVELPGLEDNSLDDTVQLPGLENNSLDDTVELPGLEDNSLNDTVQLPGLEDNFLDDTVELSGLNNTYSNNINENDNTNSVPEQFGDIGQNLFQTEGNSNYENRNKNNDIEDSNYLDVNSYQEEQIPSYSSSEGRKETIQKLEENTVYQTGALNTVLTKDKKIVAFVGASKSGTSFLVNNLACLFSSIGVKTAILDMTQNKNSYYIYTNNDEKLRNIAYTSIENLENGIAEGIKVDRNLNVYTTIPNDGKDYSNSEAILSTLIQNESLVLIDCDFNTDLGYFANAQEIYLVQSMDILTIQPLTAFLRDLKTKGILEQEKLRIVINKELKVRSLSSKAVIGGMSFYNDPAMSYMTELFNKDRVKACTIPFDESVYSKYLEAMVNCVVTISGYTKNFMNSLKILGNMVYPLLSKQTYATKGSTQAQYGSNFSTEMNNTLDQMKKKY